MVLILIANPKMSLSKDTVIVRMSSRASCKLGDSKTLVLARKPPVLRLVELSRL